MLAVSDLPVVAANLTGLSSGGGLTYLLGMTAELGSGGGRGLRWRLIVSAEQRAVMKEIRSPDIEICVLPARAPVRRVAWEWVELPRSGLTRRASVLLGGANFARGRRGLPCVVVAHNALYFSAPDAGGIRMRIERGLAHRSLRTAAASVVGSGSMAGRVRAATGASPTVIPFGPGLSSRWEPPDDGPFTFVHRTTWGPHKRLDVLLAAVRLLARDAPGEFRVITACDPRTPFARKWQQSQHDLLALEDPAIAAHVQFASYEAANQDVIAGHSVVMPGDLESFCFPLAEALALGIPTVTSDADFARECCGDAAFYALAGEATSLAEQMTRLLHGERPPKPTPELLERISWTRHVDGLAEVCLQVATQRGSNREHSEAPANRS